MVTAVIKIMDAILVKKTLKGDKTAFNQLVAKYQTQVYGLAFNILGNFSDAEDLAQEDGTRQNE